MKECFVIIDRNNGKVYSESEYMWSICVGTFYATSDEAVEVMLRDKIDMSHCGVLHLYDY